MTSVSRRRALAGVAAMMTPSLARAAPRDDERLRAALDSLPKRDPAAALARLAPFDPERLSLSPRLDLLTVRAGLEIDRRLAALPAGSEADGAPMSAAAYELRLAQRLGSIRLATARSRLAAMLDAVTRRADGALRGIGMADGSVGDRLGRLMTDRRFLYPDTDAGRDQAVAAMNQALAARRAQLPAAFVDFPPWCLDVSVRRAHGDELAGRRILPHEGSPGGYVVDLADIARRPSWTLGSVVAHETLPGHLLQLPIEAASGMHPARAPYAVAFVEGWAIYAEQLAVEQGAFGADGLSLIGHLHWLLFRVARAIVDIGIHVDGWSGARAQAFLTQHQGPPVYFAPYDVEVRRILAEPVERAADALMWLTVADLAPAEWRERRRFHAVVLAGGRKRREHLIASWRSAATPFPTTRRFGRSLTTRE